MPDDLLGTVKTAFESHAKCPHNLNARYTCRCSLCGTRHVILDWLRALVARCEQAEAAHGSGPMVALVAERDAARTEVTRLREAVEAAWREGWIAYDPDRELDESWLASEAKARLT